MKLVVELIKEAMYYFSLEPKNSVAHQGVDMNIDARINGIKSKVHEPILILADGN